jgi:hypothetical protein
MKIPVNLCRSIGFNSVLGVNGPPSLPSHHYDSSLDLRLHYPLFPDDDRSLPSYFAGEPPIDPDRPFEGQLSFKFRPSTYQGADFFLGKLSFFSQTAPSKFFYLFNRSTIRSSSSGE